MRSLTAANKMLPIPPDDFEMPEISEDQFNNPTGGEDETLLATGAWGDEHEGDE